MKTKKTARFINDIAGFSGEAKLYRVKPHVAYDAFNGKGFETRETEYVVVSATVAAFSGPETYIFPAAKDGTILGWGELDGSFRGDLDHERALRNAGYDIKKGG